MPHTTTKLLLGFCLVLLLPSVSCSKKTSPRPNILIAIMDDASFPHMGAYGCDWVKTPAFDRVAKEGLLFNRAYTPNAKCAPSRSCILTGRNSWQLEEAANHWCYFPQKFKTYAEVLSENGYHVGYTTKGWAPGVVLDAQGKKRSLTGKAYNESKLEPPTRFISKNDYAANFTTFLDDRSEAEPFCFWYGSIEPHRRYEFGSGLELGGKNVSEVDKVFEFWPDNDSVRTDMLDYAYEIEYFDQHLAKMMAELEERGLLENTLIVVTADNGMPFPRIKGQEYELSNHLPLAIMWPEGIQNPGRTVEDFVSFIDFAPTFLEVAGLDGETTGMQSITGQSLTDLLADKQSDTFRDHVLIGKERHDIGRPNDGGYPIRGIVKGEYLYVHNFATDRWPAGNPETGYLNCDGSPTKTQILNLNRSGIAKQYWQMSFGKRPAEELYHLESDPECLHNLAADPAYTNLKMELKNQMETELKTEGDPRILGKGEVFDTYEYADQSGVNFFERYQKGEKLNWGWVNEGDFEKE
jgi:N-sulfoglucosamine sulfohydrolase